MNRQNFFIIKLKLNISYYLKFADPSYAEKFLIMQKQKYPDLFKTKPAVTETSYKQKVLELSDGSKTTRLFVLNSRASVGK